MKGYKFLLIGAPGSGKTHSAASFLACKGIEKVCFLFTENSAATFESDAFPWKKELGKRLHVRTAIPSTGSFKDMIDTAKKVSSLSMESLQQLPMMGGAEIRQAYHKILTSMVDYECEISGENLGPIDTWPPSYALIVDSLSGINSALIRLRVGNKPILRLDDWQIIMAQERELIERLTGATDCQIVLTSHLTRDKDEVTGAMVISPDALGTKLGPTIGRYFDDVILAKYNNGDFTWSTSENNIDLKARLLQRGKKLQPTFAQLKQLQGDTTNG